MTGTLQPEREIEILRPEGIEQQVETAQLTEQRGAHHHCAAAGDAWRDAIVLTPILFADADGFRASQPPGDVASSPVVEERRAIKVAQLGLHLSHARLREQ